MIDVLNYPPPDWADPPSDAEVERALALNARGQEYLDDGDLQGAEVAFMESIQATSLISLPWFNLGLVYKFQRRWEHSAVCNQRSLDLEAEEQDPAYWNLGIAATARRDWATARAAWSGYGVDIELGDDPIELDYGSVPVRINPAANAEVCWGRRVGPARILLESIPMPGSNHRWNDIVLHDGAPNGERTIGDRTVPVFDEIERWEVSASPTWECILTAEPGGLEGLPERFGDNGMALEDWTAGIRMLCPTCSEGSPGAHEHRGLPAQSDGHHVGLAGQIQQVTELLDTWVGESPARSRTDILAVDS